MEVFIFGICREIFFFFSEKRVQKLGSVLYMGAHYRRVNTVIFFLSSLSYLSLLVISTNLSMIPYKLVISSISLLIYLTLYYNSKQSA